MRNPTLYDNHNRPLTYARISVTDRCNLRCFYCMPAEGITYVAKEALLSYEELFRLTSILAGMGISKIRITGGEPFVRKDLVPFLHQLNTIEGIEEIHITTNGVLTGRYLNELKALAIASVNLSLDTLNPQRFYEITRRDEFTKVWNFLEQLVSSGIRTKVNMVVMEDKNEADIIPMAELTRHYPIDVRFIEEMPFNGTGMHYAQLKWNHKYILSHLRNHYSDLQSISTEPYSTSTNYQIPGYKGKIGIIAAFSRTFCGTCNRIRITAQGQLKTCLYDNGVLDLRQLLRSTPQDELIREELQKAFRQRTKDGYEAEKLRKFNGDTHESMATIGG